MKNLFFLTFWGVVILSACRTQTDNAFDSSSLNHEVDSITNIILRNKQNAYFSKTDYTPNKNDVDRCIEIYDTLIAHKMGTAPIIGKLRMLSIAKRYSDFIEFGRSETCSSNEIYPVPKVFKYKLNAMQCHLDEDHEGEKKNKELALECINQYMSSNKSVFDNLMKMDKDAFNSIVITNSKTNQPYVKAMIVIQMYQLYYTYANGNDAWKQEYDKLRKNYPNAHILETIKDNTINGDIMDF